MIAEAALATKCGTTTDQQNQKESEDNPKIPNVYQMYTKSIPNDRTESPRVDLCNARMYSPTREVQEILETLCEADEINNT